MIDVEDLTSTQAHLTGGAEPSERPVDIPLDSISDEALRAIVREFVLREGTDYGAQEVSQEVKERQVHDQLEKGLAKIVFDLASETASIIPTKDNL